jgi:hypothetical protein
MKTPTTYTPEQIIRMARENGCQLPDGRYVAARPEGFWGLCLRNRLRSAWMVFTGRADVLTWTGQP